MWRTSTNILDPIFSYFVVEIYHCITIDAYWELHTSYYTHKNDYYNNIYMHRYIFTNWLTLTVDHTDISQELVSYIYICLLSTSIYG
jgi:hypothetical protein